MSAPVYCESCEQMTHPTHPHSCFSAATLRAHKEAEAAVIEAAKAMCDVINPPKMESYTDYKAAAGVFIAAVAALRALERDA